MRVLELTNAITGPLCGQMLGDLGADVVKVEHPDGGDMFRAWQGGLYGPYFVAFNRNKRSVACDLQTARGKDTFLALVATADVLLENFRPGVMRRLGLGSDVLRATNPKLIECSITGFGSDGPYTERPAYDTVAQALSGLSSVFLDPSSPQIVGPTLADNITGMYACYGILAALIERSRTGIARRVEVNLMESSVAFMADQWVVWERSGVVPGPLTRVKASQSYALRCLDGKVLAIHLSVPEKFWEGAQRAFERADLGKDPRFAVRAARIENYLDLKQELETTTMLRPRGHWMSRLEAEDVPFAPVLSLPEVLHDPQIAHLDTFVRIDHPTEGRMTLPRCPVRFDGRRDDQPLQAPPALGEHSEAVVRELGVRGEE
jgi:formyl-CoA transferase